MRYRLLLVGLLALISFSLDAQKIGDTIMKDGYKLIPSEGGMLIGFVRQSDGKIGFIQNSSDMNVMIEPKFEDMYNENFNRSKRILVKMNGKWGALDATFKTSLQTQIVPCIYDSLTPFKDGKSWATLNGERFQIDLYGNRIR